DGRPDPLARQRQPHLLALPFQVGTGGPVLQRAAPAVAVVGRDRRDPVRAGRHHPDDLGAAVADLGPHGFSGQGQGCEHRAGRRLGDPVALPAHVADGQRFRHRPLLGPSRAGRNLNEDERRAQKLFSFAPLTMMQQTGGAVRSGSIRNEVRIDRCSPDPSPPPPPWPPPACCWFPPRPRRRPTPTRAPSPTATAPTTATTATTTATAT